MYKLALIIAIVGGLVLINLNRSYFFNTDYARDLYQMIIISRGHPTLIGPWLSAGFFTTPYYYYLFLPPLVFSGFNAYAPLIANALLFITGTGVFALVLSRCGSPWPVLGLVLSPFFLISARGAGNAYSYLPFLSVFLCLVFLFHSENKRYYFSLGLLTALIINFHPVSLLAIIPAGIYIFRRPSFKSKIFWFLLPVVVSLTPLLFFELRHGFVMTRGLIHGSSSGLVFRAADFGSVTGQLRRLLIVHPLVYLCGFAVLSLGRCSLVVKLTIVSLVSFLFTVMALPLNPQPHYLLPVCTVIIFSAVVIFSQKTLRWFIPFWLFFLVLEFPVNLYAPSSRPLNRFSSAVNYVSDNHLIRPGEAFNVLGVIDSANKVVNGNEYRFFLVKSGLHPLPEWDYASARKLLIFSEDDSYPLSQFNIWETNQFGQEYLSRAQKFDTGEVVLYYALK